MNDETLIRLLASADAPVQPSPAFAERLFQVVRIEAARPRRLPVRPLLAAAALLVLTLTAVSAYLLATQPRDEHSVVPPPPLPSVNPSIDASVLPHFAGTQVWSATHVGHGPYVYMAVADGVVWLTQSDPDIPSAKVVHIDPATGTVTDYPLPPRVAQIGPPAVGSSRLYFTGYSGVTDFGLWHMDLATPGVFAEQTIPAGTGRDLVDDRGENWFQHGKSLSLRKADGTTQWNVAMPWDVSEDSLGNYLAPFASFGSLWAYRASANQVLRLDLESGTVSAVIDPPGCVAKAGSNARGIPERLYPLTGVPGLPDAMVFVCASDGGQTRLVVIDPAVNRAVATFDVGPYNGSFGVPGQALVCRGHLLVPLGLYPDSALSQTQIVEIDPASGSMKVAYELPAGQHVWAAPVFVSGDALWVLAKPDNELQTTSLLRLTPDDK